MYFVVIIAFALLLADGLPPAELNLFPLNPANRAAWAHSIEWTTGLAIGQVVLLGIYAWVANRLILKKHDGTPDGIDRAQERHSRAALGLLVLLGASMVLIFICTP